MPMMTPSQAKIADPVLTEFARGYTTPGLVGTALFPRVQTPEETGLIPVFGKESWYAVDLRRAPGATIPRMTISYSSQRFVLDTYSRIATVPRETLMAAERTGILIRERSVAAVLDMLARGLERDIANLVSTAANYPTGHTATLSGSSQWSDPSSNPALAIQAAASVIQQDCGQYPNTLLLGSAVFDALAQHPLILDRIKYTQLGLVTEDLLASLFRIEQVVVGRAVSLSDAGTASPIWGKIAVLAYVRPLASRYEPHFGATYTLAGYPVVEAERDDWPTNSVAIPVHDYRAAVLADGSAGYLFLNAVA